MGWEAWTIVAGLWGVSIQGPTIMFFFTHPIIRHSGKAKCITHLLPVCTSTWINQNLTNRNLREPKFFYRPLVKPRGKLQTIFFFKKAVFPKILVKESSNF